MKMLAFFSGFHRLMHTKSLILLLSLSLFSVFGLGACGGSDDSSSNDETGQVNISLTDAEGDFITYTVDVLSLTLTKANGTVVETLPLQTRVDFAQYTDMIEFLTAATIPSGVYVKGTLTLDYGNSEIWVEDANGNGVKVETILDSNGEPIETLEVSVNLEGRSALPIAPGIPMHLALDFDLKASNTIEFVNGNPIQTVEPFLIAEVDIESNKIQRLRGPLKSVDVDNNRFQLFIRPFYHRLVTGARHLGALHVETSDNTLYEIDGVSYQGADGLQTLSEATTFTGVIVRGKLKFHPFHFEATEVYAGSSVPGGDMDVVSGSVVARSGDDITLRGATLLRADGVVVFNDNVTINLADSTIVKKQLSMGTFSIDDISVGQRLIAFGTITNDQVSNLTLDAANGYARMLLSYLRGSVVTNDVSPTFDLQLSSINGRNPGLYDFSGTGSSIDTDADPANYEVDTSTLDVSPFVVDSKVAVAGFVRPFGLAPKDFNAHTVLAPQPQ